MAYIYEIINDVNGKRYIGKTEFDINKRFKEHCYDAFRERNEKRPLYMAMRKYGIEHFYVQLIEETDAPEEREIYWIEQKQSFHHGYNATIGGDGKRFLNYDAIIQTYLQIQNIKETARMHGVSRDSVQHILKENNIDIRPNWDVASEKLKKPVGMYDIDNNSILIKIFVSTKDAADYLIENKIANSPKNNGVSSHIADVCNNKRKSAYGYFWQYLN